jgi:hypothetical protein
MAATRVRSSDLYREHGNGSTVDSFDGETYRIALLSRGEHVQELCWVR